jgi:hypothetical protein
LNPAVTLTFWRLGNVASADALFYALAQFAGGAAGTLLLAGALGDRFTLPPISAVAMLPGQPGEVVAFAAEITIAFVLMSTVLATNASARLTRWTGLGGGTLAYRLAPSGKRTLILERGDYLPRERENWSAEAVFGEERYKARERPGRPGTTRTAVPSIPAFIIASAATPRCTARSCCGCASGISRRSARQTECLRLGRFPTPILRRTTPKPRGSTMCTGLVAAIRPSRLARSPTRFWPSRTSRIQALAEDLERAGHRPFPLPVGIMLDEQRAHDSHRIRCNTCDGFPCLVQAMRAWAGPGSSFSIISSRRMDARRPRTRPPKIYGTRWSCCMRRLGVQLA